jgi:hypothetical protein
MIPLPQHTKAWIRWLALCGLPPDHVAHTLEVDQADVVYVLSKRGKQPTAPPAKSPGQSKILAQSGTKARRMHALGYAPDHIARCLDVWTDDVVSYLRRVTPLRRPRSSDRTDLVRARPISHVPVVRIPKPPKPPNPALDFGNWTLAAPIVDTPPPVPPPPVKLPPVDVPAFVASVPRARDVEWQAHYARGERNGKAALSDADAVKLRELRACGRTRRELAALFNISMATVGRILARQTYTDAENTAADVEPPLPIADVPVEPSPSSSPAPPSNRWAEPVEKDWRWRD